MMSGKSICKLALINKSTFYNHYEDVFALSRELEDEVLAQCLDFEYKDHLLTDPEKFLKSLPQSYAAQKPMIDILYAGRTDALYSRQMQQLRECFRPLQQTAKDDVLLTFLIGGTMYTVQHYAEENAYSVDELNEILAKIIKAAANYE